jgi:hypothetical protein
LAKGTPFAAVQQRELFKNVIVHEVIHGVLQQNTGPHVMSYVAQEYVAYALQLESLPASERFRYFRSIKKTAQTMKTDDLGFTDMLLLADPFLFAAYAYEHYRASGSGCVHLTGLMKGRVPFVLTPLY